MHPSIQVTDEKLKSSLVFLGRLLVMAVPLYAIMLFVNLMPLQLAVAGHSEILLRIAGFEVFRTGTLIETGGFQFFISPDSTGWKSMVFLGALILAVPGVAWRYRGFGLLIGLPVIYLANLGRVLAIVGVEASYGLEAAMFTHDVMWRFGLVALVIGLWLAWLKVSRRSDGD